MRIYILLLVMATAMAGCGVARQNDRTASTYSSSPQLAVCLNVHGVDPEGFMDCVRNSNSATPGVGCTTAQQRPLTMRCVAEENGRRLGSHSNDCLELFGAANCAAG